MLTKLWVVALLAAQNAQPAFADEEDLAEADGEEMMEALAGELPYMTGMMAKIVHDDPDSQFGWCDDEEEFLFGLDLILDGLETRSARQAT